MNLTFKEDANLQNALFSLVASEEMHAFFEKPSIAAMEKSLMLKHFREFVFECPWFQKPKTKQKLDDLWLFFPEICIHGGRANGTDWKAMFTDLLCHFFDLVVASEVERKTLQDRLKEVTDKNDRDPTRGPNALKNRCDYNTWVPLLMETIGMWLEDEEARAPQGKHSALFTLVAHAKTLDELPVVHNRLFAVARGMANTFLMNTLNDLKDIIQIKKSFNMVPLATLKAILRAASNPIQLANRMLGFVFARPFGSRSLLQRQTVTLLDLGGTSKEIQRHAKTVKAAKVDAEKIHKLVSKNYKTYLSTVPLEVVIKYEATKVHEERDKIVLAAAKSFDKINKDLSSIIASKGSSKDAKAEVAKEEAAQLLVFSHMRKKDKLSWISVTGDPKMAAIFKNLMLAMEQPLKIFGAIDLAGFVGKAFRHVKGILTFAEQAARKLGKVSESHVDEEHEEEDEEEEKEEKDSKDHKDHKEAIAEEDLSQLATEKEEVLEVDNNVLEAAANVKGHEEMFDFYNDTLIKLINDLYEMYRQIVQHDEKCGGHLEALLEWLVGRIRTIRGKPLSWDSEVFSHIKLSPEEESSLRQYLRTETPPGQLRPAPSPEVTQVLLKLREPFAAAISSRFSK